MSIGLLETGSSSDAWSISNLPYREYVRRQVVLNGAIGSSGSGGACDARSVSKGGSGTFNQGNDPDVHLCDGIS